MQKIVGIKREGDKDIYYFLENIEVKEGDKVVVQFEEFQTVGTVVRVGQTTDDDKANQMPKITRKATESDLKKYNELKKKAKSELDAIKKKSLELGLVMKFVWSEYSLDNSKVIITFSSEERVDFRQFLKELASMLKTRIELKQIGQRDEVKIVGGVGPCGEPCCCARFLKDFDHVTVKMAKVQGLSLSPTKINGVCGRLMCCLGYESGTYEEVLSRMPKVNSEVTSPKGKGVVVYNDILRERVSVKRQAEGDTFVVEDYDLDEISWGDKKAVAVKKEEKKENIQVAEEINLGETSKAQKTNFNQQKSKENFEQKKVENESLSLNENPTPKSTKGKFSYNGKKKKFGGFHKK